MPRLYVFDELLQLLDEVDARRVASGHVVRLRLGLRAQLLGGGSWPTGEQLGELLEVDGGEIDTTARLVALDDGRGDRHALDLLVQQRLDLRRDGGDVYRAELAAYRLGEDMQRRNRL